MERKDFIKASMIASAAGLALPISSFIEPSVHKIADNEPAPGKIQVSLFSKQLQWLNYQDMAHFVADMGYDGIDLTVRKGGLVLPENVERDLPKAVEAASKAGIKILIISTDIGDTNDFKAEAILKTAAGLGIKYYRSAGLSFQKELSIPANLYIIKKKFTRLAELNKKYGFHSDYLNHSDEGAFGATTWDLWYALKDLDPKYLGSQFDIKHATIDGPFSWPVSLNLIHQYVKTFCVRDFRWENKNTWVVKPVPLGEGMVDLKKFFGLVKQYNIKGPISLMCDYDLGGAQDGARTITMPKAMVAKAMKKDLDTLRGHLKAFDL